MPGEAAAAEVSPVMRVLDEVKASSASDSDSGGRSEEDAERLASLLDELRELCSGDGLENAAVAARNGGVEALVALCASAGVKQERLLASGLKALSSLLCGKLMLLPLRYEDVFCFGYAIISFLLLTVVSLSFLL